VSNKEEEEEEEEEEGSGVPRRSHRNSSRLESGGTGSPALCPRLLRKVDVRLPGKGKSNSHGARPVHLIITTKKWIRTSRLSIKNSLRACFRDCGLGVGVCGLGFEVWGLGFRAKGLWFRQQPGSDFRGQGPGFGVWGLGFRIKDLGCGDRVSTGWTARFSF